MGVVEGLKAFAESLNNLRNSNPVGFFLLAWFILAPMAFVYTAMIFVGIMKVLGFIVKLFKGGDDEAKKV